MKERIVAEHSAPTSREIGPFLLVYFEKAEFGTAPTCRFLMKKADFAKADSLVAFFVEAKAKIDVVQFNRQVLRIKSADRLEFAPLHREAGPRHGRDFVNGAVPPGPALIRVWKARAEMPRR